MGRLILGVRPFGGRVCPLCLLARLNRFARGWRRKRGIDTAATGQVRRGAGQILVVLTARTVVGCYVIEPVRSDGCCGVFPCLLWTGESRDWRAHPLPRYRSSPEPWPRRRSSSPALMPPMRRDPTHPPLGSTPPRWRGLGLGTLLSTRLRRAMSTGLGVLW